MHKPLPPPLKEGCRAFMSETIQVGIDLGSLLNRLTKQQTVFKAL